MSTDNQQPTPPPPPFGGGAASTSAAAPPPPPSAPPAVGHMRSAAAGAPGEGSKSFVATWLLAWLVGVLGIDRFYLGKVGTGILKLVTIGGLGIWWLVDLILVLAGTTRDRQGYALAGYRENRKIAWIVTGAVIVAGLIINGVNGVNGVNAGADRAADQPAVSVPAAEDQSADVEPADVTPTEEAPAEETPAEEAAPVEEAPEPDVPAEYLSALSKAQTYSDMMHMSKAGLYDQLTAEYGEQFTPEAAQYAIDHVEADWNANALAKAKTYQETMSMSPAAIHDQLTSEYGEKFTASEADYAIAHLND